MGSWVLIGLQGSRQKQYNFIILPVTHICGVLTAGLPSGLSGRGDPIMEGSMSRGESSSIPRLASSTDTSPRVLAWVSSSKSSQSSVSEDGSSSTDTSLAMDLVCSGALDPSHTVMAETCVM